MNVTIGCHRAERPLELSRWPLYEPRQRSDFFAGEKRVSTMAVHYSSVDMAWETPPALFAQHDAEFGFTLDVCASPDNAKCARYFTVADDGLAQSWAGERCWMNPPYGRAIGKWIAKAHAESLRGALVVCLIPSRTDTAWWHDHIGGIAEIRFLRGRVKFLQSGVRLASAPFPSAIVIYRPARRRIDGDAPLFAEGA